MTKKETIKRLIKLLTDTANRIPKTNWQQYIDDNGINCGVCWLARKIGIDLYWEEWVKYWCGFDDDSILYWIKEFNHATTREVLLQLFETRIFILTMELESGVE